MLELTLIQKIAVWAIPVIFAITVHEVAHGWVANRLGDPTARMLGRLTLNPIKHVDPLGTILIPALLLAFNTGFIFGWAKPVPVTAQNLKNPRRDMAVVAAAGPIVNLIMAVLWALVARFAQWLPMESLVTPLTYMGFAGISINLLLAVLNLLPIPPLDGGRVVSNLLPPRASARFDQIEPYGFFILLGLIITGALGYLLGPPYALLQSLIVTAVGF